MLNAMSSAVHWLCTGQDYRRRKRQPAEDGSSGRVQGLRPRHLCQHLQQPPELHRPRWRCLVWVNDKTLALAVSDVHCIIGFSAQSLYPLWRRRVLRLSGKVHPEASAAGNVSGNPDRDIIPNPTSEHARGRFAPVQIDAWSARVMHRRHRCQMAEAFSMTATAKPQQLPYEVVGRVVGAAMVASCPRRRGRQLTVELGLPRSARQAHLRGSHRYEIARVRAMSSLPHQCPGRRRWASPA